MTNRKGAILPLVASFMIVMMMMAAFAIDLAYMQLAKTQLRAATDAAAKAGASAIVQGQSAAEVESAAISMAAMNKVGIKPLTLTSANITLGQSVQQADGTWLFAAGAQPYQSVQISANLSNANGIPSLFGTVMGYNDYTVSNTAVATASACDACLVLDRSNSMCWDTSGTVSMYPPPILSNIPLGIESPPQPGCRWLSLTSAVQSFCTVLGSAGGSTRVGVVTWASTISTASPEYALTGLTSPAVAVDQGLTSNLAAVYSATQARSLKPMLGGTDMASGINRGITTLMTDPGARPAAKKIMILMTDGIWNQGTDPVAAATTAKDEGIIIHCVCFLPSADQTTCQTIASTTGGKFYYASNMASLNAAFEQLAQSLPVGLTR